MVQKISISHKEAMRLIIGKSNNYLEEYNSGIRQIKETASKFHLTDRWVKDTIDKVKEAVSKRYNVDREMLPD